MGGQGRPDGHALGFATGQGPQWAASKRGQSEQVQRFFNASAHDVSFNTQGLHGVSEFIFNRVGHKAGSGILAHESDNIGKFAGWMLCGVSTIDDHGARERSTAEVGN